jgi:hypothetical protein
MTIHIRSSIFNRTERLHEPKTFCVDIRIFSLPMDTADMTMQQIDLALAIKSGFYCLQDCAVRSPLLRAF